MSVRSPGCLIASSMLSRLDKNCFYGVFLSYIPSIYLVFLFFTFSSFFPSKCFRIMSIICYLTDITDCSNVFA